MIISRSWAMPNKETFKMRPLIQLLERHGLQPCFEAFPYGPELDVLDRLLRIPDASKLTVILDPPYSPRQAKECYGLSIDAATFTKLLKQVKDEIRRVVAPGGKVITCGWNSAGMGIKRGFGVVEIMLIAHGGEHHDTIVTVERLSNGLV